MTLLRALRVAAVALFALFAALGSASSAYAIDTGFRYEINPQHNFGKCVDAPLDARPNIGISQFDCHGRANQRFRFNAVGNGLYEIRASHNNMCLDVAGGSLSNKAAIITFPCNGQANQRFRLLDDKPGIGTSTRIRAEHSKKCLDVAGARNTNVLIIQFTCSGLPHQIFDLTGSR